jgi:class 3 adenylate cyclase
VRRYQEAASAVIQRYGGYVAQYLGDGMLVYFGVPADLRRRRGAGRTRRPVARAGSGRDRFPLPPGEGQGEGK